MNAFSAASSRLLQLTHALARSRAAVVLLASVGLVAFTGCLTTQGPAPKVAVIPPPQVLQAGDVIHLSFPGTAAMDTTQQIRRDGKVNLSIVGEITAAGKTPAELEKELLDVYASQLVSKEVKVTLVSSSFAVFVTGAVVRPGKIQPDHAVTAFDAIMEAGGFDYDKANMHSVRVIRTQSGKTQTYTIDMKAILDGKGGEPFYLQNNDTVYVPERFQWF